MSGAGEAARPRPGLVRSLTTALALQWRAAPLASAAVVGLTAAGASMPALGAWLAKQIVDQLAHGAGDRDALVALAIAAGAAIGLAAVLAPASRYLEMKVRRRVALAVDRSLFAVTVALPGLRNFEDPQFQGRLRMAEQAATEAPVQFTELASALIRTAVTVASLVGVVFVVSPALSALLLFAGGIALAAQIVRSRSDVALMEQSIHSMRWRDFYRALLLDVRAAKEIRLFGLGDLFLGRMVGALARGNARELAVERRTDALQAVFAAATCAIIVLGTVVVVLGCAERRFQVGDVMLFLAAVGGIQGAFATLVFMLGMSGRTLHMFQSYLELVALPVDPPGPVAALPPVRVGIELRDVWFRYSPDSPWVLQGVDLTIPRGAAVGLVGVNGAGKSTLVKLLCRFYDAERGQILWDGVDVREIDPRALRRRIGATFQDFMTYDLSAAENVGLGAIEHLDDLERIRAAARRAEIDGTLAALPRGYATLLSRVLPGEEDADDTVGTALSGGEWQRVALARSLMRTDVDLLILDEPSSGLDAEAEHQIQQILRQHGAQRAQLLISHRLSALRGADTIAVLAGGRVVEQGTHDALMLAAGHYARLFTMQASGYQDERVAARKVEAVA
ncbi:MAG TPA: ABC transporter ATP-binding protein [Kofleriaceae bacterium]|nr:ABC transporter ATP-binding protein [Kofleriaceae bacterium]